MRREGLLRDADDLRLHIPLEPDDRILPPEPRLLRAAERHERAGRPVLVDPRGADLETLGDRFAPLEIIRPDRAREPVARIVRAPNRILDLGEPKDRHDRTELLLAHEPRRLVDIRDEGRREEIARAV